LRVDRRRGAPGAPALTPEYAIGLILSLALGGYLLYALLWPERF
jgi:K+-transporting ATPase KdpF subunit